MRLHFWVAAILLAVVAIAGNAICYGAANRQEAVDSMIKKLPAMHDDSMKVIMLDNITFELADLDPDKMEQYVRWEFTLAKKIGWVRGMGMGCVAIALYHEVHGNADSCVAYNEQAIGYFKEINFGQGQGVAYSTISNTYLGQSIFDKALDNGFKALALFEEAKDKFSIARMHVNIAGAYQGMKKYDQAIKNYKEAQKEMIALNDSFNLINVLTNLSTTYQEVGNLKEALACERQALYVSRQLQDAPQIGSSLMGLSGVFLALKQYDSSILCNYESYNIFASVKNEQGQADNLLALGAVSFKCYQDSGTASAVQLLKQLYHTNNLLALADSSLTRAVTIFNRHGSLGSTRQCYELLAKVAESSGDYRRALACYRTYTNINDSILASQNAEKIAGYEKDRALAVKERQIQEDNRKSKERLLFVSITGLLMAIVVIVVWNFYRQRKLTEQKQQLADQKEGLLKEKDVLIKEIHHRVKNNLQVVVSLLDLQTGNTDDELARRTMTESAARVKSISLIHRFLYQHDDITGIEYNNFIKELFAQVVVVFKRPGQNIVLKEQVPVTVLDIDTAVPLGLILNELFVNSFKYAFPLSDGTVEIALVAHTETYELTYRDSGPGLSDDFDIKKATSTGMTIMRNLSKQLGGKISYEKKNNTFSIVFKDILGRKKIL